MLMKTYLSVDTLMKYITQIFDCRQRLNEILSFSSGGKAYCRERSNQVTIPNFHFWKAGDFSPTEFCQNPIQS